MLRWRLHLTLRRRLRWLYLFLLLLRRRLLHLAWGRWRRLHLAPLSRRHWLAWLLWRR